MMDRLLGIIVLILLAAFTGVVAVRVVEIDLMVITLLVLAFALYDFWEQLWPGRRNGR